MYIYNNIIFCYSWQVLGMYLQIIIQDSSREDGFIDSLVMQSALRQKKLPSRVGTIVPPLVKYWLLVFKL